MSSLTCHFRARGSLDVVLLSFVVEAFKLLLFREQPLMRQILLELCKEAAEIRCRDTVVVADVVEAVAEERLVLRVILHMNEINHKQGKLYTKDGTIDSLTKYLQEFAEFDGCGAGQGQKKITATMEKQSDIMHSINTCDSAITPAARQWCWTSLWFLAALSKMVQRGLISLTLQNN